ncbi:recombinase family protein [Scytonema sp. UIC 10036]|uniref:recombinase family protein n=1 Tax=Scytonema sp. UIC 10036 TaxID=2304196 RepID=UPI001A9B152B|nr:recombinase family protein [Scytonema sp. UIC 10036]
MHDRIAALRCLTMPGSNHRRYNANSIEKHLKLPGNKKTVLYARVSTQSQKDDLQAQLLDLQEKSPGNECISEIGSRLNFQRQKFLGLIERVFLKQISLIVVATTTGWLDLVLIFLNGCVIFMIVRL